MELPQLFHEVQELTQMDRMLVYKGLYFLQHGYEEEELQDKEELNVEEQMVGEVV
jgi:hypothetical protein